MKHSLTLALVSACLTLTGCACEPKIEYRYKTTLVTPPNQLIEDCEVQTPPDIDAYLAKKTWDEKEAVLTEALQDSIAKMNKCNIDKKSLRTWKKEQTDLHESKNDK